ncbi:MAG: hypothetical protein RL148_2631 [Planctomycetota bacterium]
MDPIGQLLENNRKWAARTTAADPEFFDKLSRQQAPQYLWIGCSDSRVPANQIVGLMPGEVFVHRNVANVVVHADLNCLSVIHYAVEVLKVRHVIVCGHHGCGGVEAVVRDSRVGLVDNWLRHVRDVHEKHRELVLSVADRPDRRDLLCELNVIEQCLNVCGTTVVQDAWSRGQQVTVTGLIYGLKDGIIHNLDFHAAGTDTVDPAYLAAVSGLRTRHWNR